MFIIKYLIIAMKFCKFYIGLFDRYTYCLDNINYIVIKFLAISSSSWISLSSSTKFKTLWDFILFEKRGFTVFQKLLFPVTEDRSSFAKWSFLAVRRRLPQKFHCFLCSFLELSVSLRKNFLQSLERFVIALCRSFVMNLPWFSLRYFFFKGTCLLKISVNKFRKCWKLRGQLVRTRSLQEEFSEFSKQVLFY